MTDFNSTLLPVKHQPIGALAAGGVPPGPPRGPIIPENETYLTPEELAERYPGVTVRTLATWRFVNAKRVGPPFIKVGLKIYYPLSLLLQWEQSNLTVMTAPTSPPPND